MSLAGVGTLRATSVRCTTTERRASRLVTDRTVPALPKS